MKKTITLLVLSILMLSINLTSNAQISGTVYRDFNNSATREVVATYTEPMVPGVIVNAYNGADILIASYTTTSGTGFPYVAPNYTIPASGTAYNGTVGSNTGFVPSGLNIRLEFITPNTGACLVNNLFDFSTKAGGTSVQFITGGATNVNSGINNPADYVFDASPFSNTFIFQAVQSGIGNPTASPAGTAASRQAFVKFPYNRSGTTALGATEILATAAQIGSVYGVAYSKQANRIFTSAYLKRHAGFGPANGTESNKPGAIYIIDPTKNSTTTAATYFTSLDALGFPTHNSTGTPVYGSGTSYTIASIGTGITTQQTVNYSSAAAQAVIGTNIQRGLTLNSVTPSNDPAAYGQIGTLSLGDIEISDDGLYLFVTNLYDRKIYQLQLNNVTNPTSATVVTSWALPNPPARSTSAIAGAATTYASATAGFYNGTVGFQRPFALKYYRGKVYVGAVTTGEVSGTSTKENNTGNCEYTDLWSYVWELSASSGFNTTPILAFPLNFDKGTGAQAVDESWKPWSKQTPVRSASPDFEALNQQAMFTGIEFDVEGSIILSFRDRLGDQGSYDQYILSGTTEIMRTIANGDMLRAYKNTATCVYELEQNGKEGPSSPKPATAGAGNKGGPGNYTTINQSGEFYYQDGLEVYNGGAGESPNWHINTSQGSVSVLPGSGEVTASYMDPMSTWSGGVSWMNNTNGTNTRDYEIYAGTATGNNGKGCGLGDLEMLTQNAPIELGNRLWNDVNGDGIQEAGEAVLSGVTLELFDTAGAGTILGEVITDANGNYIFSSATGTDALGIKYALAIKENTNYIIRIKSSATGTGTGVTWNSTTGVGTSVLTGFKITKSNSIGSGAADLSDNDASLVTNVPQVSITTGAFGQNNHTIDFGFTKLASLGNKVWLDEGAGGGTRSNGVQDGTEPGVAGVAVNLYQNGADGFPNTADDVLVASTITDAFGMYNFENLQPTDQTSAATIAATSYFIRITPPANYATTVQTNGTDDNNTTGASTTGSDVDVLGQSYSINLSAGENNPNIDAGLIFKPQALPNSIGDKVWYDADGNGINANNASEPGVAGVTVTLFDAATGNIVAVTTTDANGNYLFNNVPENTNFQVGFSAPAGTVLTTGGTLDITNASTNSDPSPTTGKTATFSSGAAGTQITGVDAGLKNDSKGAIGDFVWNDNGIDANGVYNAANRNNGIQDPGEPGVPGVTMTLYNVGADGIRGNADDGPTLTTTTDANGYYVFPNLDPSKYIVAATPISGYALSPKDVTAGNPAGNTKDNDFGGGTGFFAGSYVSSLVELKPTAGGVTRDMTIDLGIYNSTTNLNSLGDKVWNDVNKDGIDNGGSEAGVPNITVRLLNGAGAAVNNPATGKPYVVLTDADGMYRFVDLPDGNYILEFANLPAGYSFTGQDKDAANQGAPGSLIPGSLDGTTDSDAKPTTGRTAIISLDAGNASLTGVNLTNVDAGITQGISAGTASLGNRVWYDNGRDATTGLIVPANANNGLQDAGELGVNNVKVELLDALGAAVDVPGGTSTPYVIYTNALGEYLFTGLPAGDYTVRFSNLPAGFTNSLLNAGTPVNSNDDKDSDASFTGTSTTTTATTGVYTLQIGEDNLTVDMGIVPAAGTNTIGNFVWYDNGRDASGVLVPANASNGKQDAGEPGVQGVTVTLYTNGVDGIPGTADDVRVGVTTTDNAGAYNFVGLPNGNYNVGFTNLPAGFTFTDKDKASVPTADNSDANTASGRTGTYALTGGTNEREVDAGLVSTRAALGNQVWLDTDGDGLLNNGEKGVSGVTVTLYDDATGAVLASTITDADGKYYFGNLLPGDYKVGFSTIPSNLSFTKQTTAGVADNNTNNNSDADPATGLTTKITLVAGETDLTIDAGLKPDNFASVGDLVWNDLDALGTKSLTEPGVPGILATLYDATTNLPVGTAITDGSGKYLISKIPVATAGTSFYIIFSNLPAGAQFTSQTDNVTAGDVSLGSDANTATGRTSNFTLTPGQYLPTVDAGIKNVQVLPVKMESFTAVPQGNQVNLQWKVSEQINVATHEVEASIDGRTFASIATVASNGNQGATYDAVHTTPVVGINYYRIKTVEKDGTISYSEIRKVTFGKGGDVIIYPNPVQTGVVNITLTGSMINKSATVSILSMDGKLISQQQIANTNQTETIDVSRLASGSYIVRLITKAEVVNKTIQVIR
jgi:hypothetical protein